MRECQFCGNQAEQGSNEFGEFACLQCLDDLAGMQPLSSFVL